MPQAEVERRPVHATTDGDSSEARFEQARDLVEPLRMTRNEDQRDAGVADIVSPQSVQQQFFSPSRVLANSSTARAAAARRKVRPRSTSAASGGV